MTMNAVQEEVGGHGSMWQRCFPFRSASAGFAFPCCSDPDLAEDVMNSFGAVRRRGEEVLIVVVVVVGGGGGGGGERERARGGSDPQKILTTLGREQNQPVCASFLAGVSIFPLVPSPHVHITAPGSGCKFSNPFLAPCFCFVLQTVACRPLTD
jgi:hypothetical protein